MKTLSNRQPWAWLIVQGIKTVENRSWATPYRGPLLIHASMRFALNAAEFAQLRKQVLKKYDIWISDDLPRGGIVGQVQLVDCVLSCHDKNDAFWHNRDDYAFVLRDARPLPFQPAKGRLHLFEFPFPAE